MPRTPRSTARRLPAFLVVAGAGLATTIAGMASAGADPVDSSAIPTCHMTGNPAHLVSQVVDASSAYNRVQHERDDIIGPFTFDGATYSLNWNETNAAILNNDCHVSATSTPPAPPADNNGGSTGDTTDSTTVIDSINGDNGPEGTIIVDLSATSGTGGQAPATLPADNTNTDVVPPPTDPIPAPASSGPINSGPTGASAGASKNAAANNVAATAPAVDVAVDAPAPVVPAAAQLAIVNASAESARSASVVELVPAAAAEGSLAMTGTNVATLAEGALLVLAFGAGTVVFTRRRTA